MMLLFPISDNKRQCNKNTEQYVQTDPEMIGLMDNQSGNTFVFPADELYDFDAVEV
jgi:translation elongation factor P/translation initiation factor 5A